MPSKNLNRANLAPLTAFLVANVGLCAWLFGFEIEGTDVTLKKLFTIGGLGMLLTTISAVLAALVPSSWKAVLVFWRIRDVLPGHRAFTPLTLNDPRIDADKLRNQIGDFPVDPRQQNTLWYRLFKKHEKQPEVEEAHGRFLLFRDMTTLVFGLAIGAVLALMLISPNGEYAWLSPLMAIGEYLVIRIAASRHGHGLVANVLALESVQASEIKAQIKKGSPKKKPN